MSNNFIKSFSIQELVNTISREEFNAFLNKFLSTTNIENMNNILNILYEKVKTEVTNATEDQKEFIYKNVYHYMMMLLYNEAITIDHAIEKLNNEESNSGNSLTSHFFKEYYTKLCGFGSSNGNAIYRKYFVNTSNTKCEICKNSCVTLDLTSI